MSSKKQQMLTTWVKLSVRGSPRWINTIHVRRFEAALDRCRVVFTSQDLVTVDQTLDEVMEAFGYKTPSKPPLEIAHQPAAQHLADTAQMDPAPPNED